ncbi:MAG TPA: carboxypeptidase-like regulatory domain-containing protein, partial [Candidatus Elarobacter sp.]|nr:carboxypeptidase-like regulatory domain-containing protein [Candidatus Elarobacter sp.]
MGFFILALATAPSAVHAQATTGTISGAVTDESKAVLPGVTIVVRNMETGATRQLVTDERGGFRALNLPPGIYSVTAELSGFTSAKRENLTLEIGREVSADLSLKVGAINENVTVEGAATNIDLSSAVAGGVVSTTQIAELPLNGRNFMQLATLQPGVTVSRATSRDFTGGFGNTQVSIGGARLLEERTTRPEMRRRALRRALRRVNGLVVPLEAMQNPEAVRHHVAVVVREELLGCGDPVEPRLGGRVARERLLVAAVGERGVAVGGRPHPRRIRDGSRARQQHQHHRRRSGRTHDRGHRSESLYPTPRRRR